MRKLEPYSFNCQNLGAENNCNTYINNAIIVSITFKLASQKKCFLKVFIS